MYVYTHTPGVFLILKICIRTYINIFAVMFHALNQRLLVLDKIVN